MAQVQTWCFNQTVPANIATVMVAPANVRRLVSVTCAFGMGVVRFSVSRADMPGNTSVWPRLPAANQWLWTLEPGEGLWVRTDVATEVGGCIKDVP